MTLAVGSTDVALLTTTTNAALTTTLGQSIVILKATVCNTDSSVHNVTIWRVPGGGTPATSAYMIWDAQPIPAGLTIRVPISGQPLLNGSQLFAKQDSGSGVNLNIGWAQL